MERRNRSIKALEELNIIDSLDAHEKAQRLVVWANQYLGSDVIVYDNLEVSNMNRFAELMYKNINFLKKHKENTRVELEEAKNIKKFLS